MSALEVTDDQILALRERAALAGDTYTVDQTFEALGEWGVFWAHCVPATPTGKTAAQNKARAWCAEIIRSKP